jgi:hypothetical protein
MDPFAHTNCRNGLAALAEQICDGAGPGRPDRAMPDAPAAPRPHWKALASLVTAWRRWTGRRIRRQPAAALRS